MGGGESSLAGTCPPNRHDSTLLLFSPEVSKRSRTVAPTAMARASVPAHQLSRSSGWAATSLIGTWPGGFATCGHSCRLLSEARNPVHLSGFLHRRMYGGFDLLANLCCLIQCYLAWELAFNLQDEGAAHPAASYPDRAQAWHLRDSLLCLSQIPRLNPHP